VIPFTIPPNLILSRGFNTPPGYANRNTFNSHLTHDLPDLGLLKSVISSSSLENQKSTMSSPASDSYMSGQQTHVRWATYTTERATDHSRAPEPDRDERAYVGTRGRTPSRSILKRHGSSFSSNCSSSSDSGAQNNDNRSWER